MLRATRSPEKLHVMDVESLLDRLRSSRHYRDQIVHVEELPARPARFADPGRPLQPALGDALGAVGVQRLYAHQAAAVDAATAGRDVVVVTSTASGKTLCYNVAVLEALLADPTARAL